MEVLSKPSLKQAVDLIRAEKNGRTVLIVGIEDCDSCRALKDDAAIITDGLNIDQLVVATLNLEDGEEHAPMESLRLTDVPATYLFESGDVRGGWFGYDYDKERDFRTQALRAAISGKLVPASA